MPDGFFGNDRHVEQFGVKQIRVLTVTESSARVDHMIDAVHDITGGKGSNFFLFAEKSRFYGRLGSEVWWTTCPFRKSYPRVLMMQPGQNGRGDNGPASLDRSR